MTSLVQSWHNPWRNYLVAVLVWSLLLGVSLFFNLGRLEDETLHAAEIAARANVNKDISFRKWATSHGGVYVPPDDRTPPNPFMSAPDQDVVTTSGKSLTLMNPAYMLRQMQNEFGNEYGIRSRITSLQPLNPANAPDTWETQALRQFSQGLKEAVGVHTLDGEPFLRLMLPFPTEKGCLKCHRHQGYEVGDIRGGIGTAVSLLPYFARQEKGRANLAFMHGIAWMLGLLGLTGFYWRTNKLELARHLAQRNLLESEERYRSAFETSVDAININRMSDGVYLEVNDVFLEIMGYQRDEVIGYSSFALNIWANQDDRNRLVAQLEQNGKCNNLEAQFRRKGGGVVWGLMSASVMELEGVPCILSITRDISERKHNEIELSQYRYNLEAMVAERTSKLRESEEKFRALATLAPVGIYLTTPDGKCQFTNPRWNEMAGISPEDALGDGWVNGLHPDDRALVFDHWQKLVESAGRWGLEYRFRTPEGKVSWVYGLAVPICDELGVVTGYIGVNLDITERKQAETALMEAKLAAESANIAKSAFLANMSHEIRTPLHAIAGMAYIIRKAGLSDKQSDQMDKLLASSNHLLEIINDILDLSKIEAGKMVLEEVPLDIQELLSELQAMVQERLKSKNLQLKIELDSLPTGLSGDATRLRQALLNYLTNAIKFTSQGVITLRVRCLEKSSNKVNLRFEVQDTGVGIDSATMERLFSAFEQADNTTTRKYGGTGLGLVITQRLAQLMGGDAGATSLPGEGSTFWFTATLLVKPVELRPEPEFFGAKAEAILKREHAGARVLLVEDEPINREIAELLLAEVGIQPDIAGDGQVALDKVCQRDYDLILMDVQMPVMNGLEATLLIRQLKKDRHIPIVAMTANAFEDDRQRCLSVGMDDFMAKPIDTEQLYAVILKWLSHSQAEADREPILLQWNDSFSVGSDAMDRQHQKLFALCNRLVEINQNNCDPASKQFEAVLSELQQYAEEHFTAEEALLQRIRYPFIAEQEAEHMGYVQEIKNLVDQAKSGGTKMPETYNFLVHWLTHHILVSDMKYRPYL